MNASELMKHFTKDGWKMKMDGSEAKHKKAPGVEYQVQDGDAYHFCYEAGNDLKII